MLITRIDKDNIDSSLLEEPAKIIREGGTVAFPTETVYGLGADGTEVTLETIAKYCDMFYIGGTKVGALFGEAVVFTKPKTIPHFFSITNYFHILS